MASRFIEQLRRSQTHAASSLRSTQQLRYQLDAGAEALHLSLHVATVAPNGSIEATVPYRLQPAHLRHPPPFLSPDDRRLLNALSVHAPGWVQSSAGPLPDSLDLDWLRQLLDTRRVQDGEGNPMCWGTPVAAGCGWRVDPDDGCQRLVWELPEPLRPLPTRPPGYWDPTTGQCGEIRSEYPPAAVAWLANAPALPPDAVAAFLRDQGTRLASWGLPQPRPLPRRRLRPAPGGMLRLFSLPEGTPGTRDRMRLGFRYTDEGQEAVFEAGDAQSDCTVVAPDAGERLVFQRDPVREDGLRLQLHAALSSCAPRVQDVRDIAFAEPRGWVEAMTRVLPALRAEGWRIEIEPGFRQYWVRPDSVAVDTRWLDRDWFELALRIELDGKPVALLPLLARLHDRYPVSELRNMPADREIALSMDDGRQVLMPVGRVLHWIQIFGELLDGETIQGHLRLPASQATRLAELDDGATVFGADNTGLLEQARTLRRGVTTEDFRTPPGLHAQLRGYQRLGIAWLQQRQRLELGGILADDMGLGKTLQVLAHLMLERAEGRLHRPALVVAPTSVLGNWIAEARRFCPELRVLLLHGAARQPLWAAVDRHELLVTSYAVLANDLDQWRGQELSAVFLDEAQAIRNPRTRIHRAVRELRASARFCLTGTPLQNHLGDLWALLDFVLPGCLDSEAAFRRRYRRPIEDDGDTLRAQALFDRIAPFLLRRTKAEVATDLPAKTEVTLRLPLEGAQRELYELLRQRSLAELRATPGDHGPEPLNVLNALLQLRQLCCDPRLLDAERYRDTGSAKREHLRAMVRELVEEGRVLLVFSQFRRMLDWISEDLTESGIEHQMLTGRTQNRQAVIDAFRQGAGQVFLISLKAGGTGLNLTRADTVIHYDPWWNDAAERQATDRAYRIGQTQPVFVYRLLAEDTVEERVHALQIHKRRQLEGVYAAAESEGERLRLTHSELLDLLEQGG
ncbi:Helicase, SNF2/RAD54 family [Thioalkalivibrio nitratireducens DSM 14787]|uniref:Helicase, SNF2/RAD54 family n=1 Tax=Thioalkalivibrio nitratireducens (strain DSM 14787 / UNIQEM 213 / ALEN2) TaxID=1255043 RepID=L0DYA4_THIND|nr:DEAD/DEAH box helicase [Thioalkalivibrio nitratireducens]AGA33930.1 Helicase, SNF2/RAD54 family [Thioalkalivibrio nitratireducens DSM 14787]